MAEATGGNSTTFQCSPALKRRPGETCLPETSLKTIARVWNELHPEERISIRNNVTRRNRNLVSTNAGATSVATQQPKGGLWRQLREAMKKHYKCGTEYCLVNKIPGLTTQQRKTMRAHFRPAKPAAWKKKPTTWLDSFNIEDVMTQYEQAMSPEFDFIGPVPIDFDSKYGAFGKCIVEELCRLDLRAATRKGRKYIGIIFNLDPHDKPGSHWVCAFVDIPKQSAYYFDSYGYPPPKEIEAFLARCKDQGCKHIYYNDFRHQRKGSECGMYCLFCIICLLKGRSFFDVCSKIVDDDTMNSFRDILFATENPRRDAIEEALPKLCA